MTIQRKESLDVTSTRTLRCRSWLVVSLVGLALFAVAPRASGTTGVTYVALGDSYASGEGLAPFIGSDTDHCDRSTQSYPYLVAASLGLSTSATSFRDVACAGAKLSDLSLSVNADPTQLSALSAGTDVLSLTIGGNDIGFGPLALSCLNFGPASRIATFRQVLCSNAIDRAERLLGAVRGGPSFASSLRARFHSAFSSELTAMVARLRGRQGTRDAASETSTLFVVTNYPVLLPAQRSASTPCQFGLGVTMSARNAGALRAVNELLNSEILSTTRLYAQRHQDPGVVAVDVARSLKPLSCTLSPGAGDVRSLDPANPSYSLHPLASGQLKMAALISAALRTHGVSLVTTTTTMVP